MHASPTRATAGPLEERLAPASASDLRLDRRDGDHGRAGRGLAVRWRRPGRARLVVRAHPGAGRQVLGMVKALPGVVIFTLVSTELRQVLQERCRALNMPCVADPGWRVERPGQPARRRRGRRSGASTRWTPAISPASRRWTSCSATTTGSAPGSSRRPTSCWSGSRGPRRPRPASISPIAASRSPTSRWCRTARCRPSSSRWATRWWWG